MILVLGASALAAQSPSPSPKPAAKARRPLSLGPWGSQYADGPPGVPILPDSPRFRDHVDVRSTPRDINTTMASWWKRFDLEHSIYGAGINVQKPVHPGSFNILPLFDWVGDKIKERKRNAPLPEPPTN